MTGVSLASSVGASALDFVKTRVLKRSVSLDGYSSAPTTAYTNEDILDETSLHTTANDDFLDDGDLTEAEDDRL